MPGVITLCCCTNSVLATPRKTAIPMEPNKIIDQYIINFSVNLRPFDTFQIFSKDLSISKKIFVAAKTKNISPDTPKAPECTLPTESQTNCCTISPAPGAKFSVMNSSSLALNSSNPPKVLKTLKLMARRGTRLKIVVNERLEVKSCILESFATLYISIKDWRSNLVTKEIDFAILMECLTYLLNCKAPNGSEPYLDRNQAI